MSDPGETRPIKLIATLVVKSGDRVFLVRSSSGPDKQTGWVVPNDEVLPDEHPSKAAKRILKDQLSFETPSVKIRDVDSFVGNDGSTHLSLHYIVEVNDQSKISPIIGMDGRWFPIDSMPPANDQAFGGWSSEIVRAVLTE
jgi:ADP-ribose pyrophosphatase YjhB (NUDIX family)